MSEELRHKFNRLSFYTILFTFLSVSMTFIIFSSVAQPTLTCPAGQFVNLIGTASDSCSPAASQFITRDSFMKSSPMNPSGGSPQVATTAFSIKLTAGDLIVIKSDAIDTSGTGVPKINSVVDSASDKYTFQIKQVCGTTQSTFCMPNPYSTEMWTSTSLATSSVTITLNYNESVSPFIFAGAYTNALAIGSINSTAHLSIPFDSIINATLVTRGHQSWFAGGVTIGETPLGQGSNCPSPFTMGKNLTEVGFFCSSNVGGLGETSDYADTINNRISHGTNFLFNILIAPAFVVATPNLLVALEIAPQFVSNIKEFGTWFNMPLVTTELLGNTSYRAVLIGGVQNLQVRLSVGCVRPSIQTGALLTLQFATYSLTTRTNTTNFASIASSSIFIDNSANSPCPGTLLSSQSPSLALGSSPYIFRVIGITGGGAGDNPRFSSVSVNVYSEVQNILSPVLGSRTTTSFQAGAFATLRTSTAVTANFDWIATNASSTFPSCGIQNVCEQHGVNTCTIAGGAMSCAVTTTFATAFTTVPNVAVTMRSTGGIIFISSTTLSLFLAEVITST